VRRTVGAAFTTATFCGQRTNVSINGYGLVSTPSLADENCFGESSRELGDSGESAAAVDLGNEPVNVFRSDPIRDHGTGIIVLHVKMDAIL